MMLRCRYLDDHNAAVNFLINNGSEFCSDVRLTCGDSEVVLSHKIILGQSSSFLHSCLADVPQGEIATMIIPDAEPEMLALLVTFLYTGTAQCSSNQQHEKLLSFMEVLCIKHFGNPTSNQESDTVNGVDLFFDEEITPRELTEMLIDTSVIKAELVDDDFADALSGSEDNRRSDPDFFKEEDEDSGSSTELSSDSFSSKPKRNSALRSSSNGDGGDNEDLQFSCSLCNSKFSTAKAVGRHEASYCKSRFKFKCHRCPFSSDAQGTLDRHLELHGNTDAFICPICERAFLSLKKMEAHKESHDRLKKYKCDLCPKSFRTQWYFETHLKTHVQGKPFQCKECDKLFSHENTLRNHEVQVHNINNAFGCTICPKSFKLQSKLEKHIMTHGRRFQCQECGKAFKFRKTLHVHMRQHTGERPFSCDLCDRTFVSKCNYKRHLLVHSGEKPHQCEYCPKRFASTSDMKDHTIRWHTKDYRHVCTKCNKGFLTPQLLRDHTAACDDDDQLLGQVLDGDPLETFDGVDGDSAKVFRCKICGNAYISAEQLKSHFRSHPKNIGRFKCDHCEYATGNQGNFITHKRRHTGVKPHLCTVCGEGFGQRVAMKNHMKRFHSTDTDKRKVYKCDICEKELYSEFGLKNHKLAHDGRKPVICLQCGKQFISASELLRHEPVHTGELPFSCGYCDRKFRMKMMMKHHEISVHTKRFPYVCGRCRKGFVRTDHKRKHEAKCLA